MRWLKLKIRRYLGIADLNLTSHIHTDELKKEFALGLDNIRQEIFLLRSELSVTMGDEFDPKRKALSNELGNRMRQKLLGEENARRNMEGKEPLKELPR